jgi:hypothetical protein
LAKEEAGEWTLGEGLVATLRLFAGEIEAAEVLTDAELVSYEGTEVLELAYEYLETGADPVARAEIERLLGLLVFSNDQLESMAGIAPAAARPSQLIAMSSLLQPAEDCIKFFHGYEDEEYLLGVFPCLEYKSVTIDGKVYRVFYPRPVIIQDAVIEWGWTEADYDLALQAMTDAVHTYNTLAPGGMPAVNMLFAIGPSPSGAGGPQGAFGRAFLEENEPCGVLVWTQAKLLADRAEDFFKQFIAHELAHCFLAELFPELRSATGAAIRWWDEGLAEHLSNVVYPTTQFEWRWTGPLEQAELSTTLFDRAYDNFIFFQHLQWIVGNPGILDVIGSLPGDIAGQRAALAAYPGMGDDYHAFAELMSDGDVADSGGGVVPYEPQAEDVTISTPMTMLQEPQPFGVVRWHVTVDPGKYACLEYTENGELSSSWRRGAPGAPGGWSDDLPDVLDGEAVFAVTATTPGALFAIEVTDVSDDDECEDEDTAPDVPTPCPIVCPPSRYYW